MILMLILHHLADQSSHLAETKHTYLTSFSATVSKKKKKTQPIFHNLETFVWTWLLHVTTHIIFLDLLLSPRGGSCLRGEHQHNGAIALTQSNISGVTPTRRVLEVSSARRLHQVIIFYCSLPPREGVLFLSAVRGRKLHSPLRGFGEPVQLIKRRASSFFFFFLHLLSPQTSIPPSRNRETWRHQSHLIWYVVFQSTSAEALWASRAAAKRRRRRRRKKEKHSLANGQKPGLEFTDPVGQPFCRPFRCTLV